MCLTAQSLIVPYHGTLRRISCWVNMKLRPGCIVGFGSGSAVNLPLGKYEYEVYVGGVLVAGFHFEVR